MTIGEKLTPILEEIEQALWNNEFMYRDIKTIIRL